MSDSSSWVVIEDEREKSFSVLKSTEIVCDEECMSVGDEVTYFWNKQELKGVVRFVSENENHCSKEAVRLNAERKRQSRKQDSFHEDQPRRAALKFKNSLKNNQKSESEPPKKQKKKSKDAEKKGRVEKRDLVLSARILNAPDSKVSVVPGTSKQSNGAFKRAEVTQISEPDESDHDGAAAHNSEKPVEDSSSESESGSDESQSSSSNKMALQLAAQIAKKFDLETLMALTKQNCDGTKLAQNIKDIICEGSPNGHTENDSHKPSSSKISSNTEERRTSVSGSHFTWEEPTLGDESLKEEDGATSEVKSSTKKKPAAFTGLMFRVTDTNNAIEVKAGTQIFCVTKNFKDAEECGSAGAAVRNLMVGIFSPDALQNCSVTGLPPRGKGREAYKLDPSLIRPSLDQDAVNVIIDQALLWQSSKHWKPKRDRGYLRNQMSVKLCEYRSQ